MEKLNLTPEEILNKEFNVDFKGYSPAEVDSFLDSVLEATLQNQVKDLTAKNIELEGRKMAFDLSNTTSYSSVDVLKRLSRLEELVYKK